MERQEELVAVLNDLIRINNDRIEGYQRASNESKDSDLDMKAIFNEMADQSRRYVTELTQEVGRLGGDPASDTTVSGKIYRVWMDLKAAISGKDRESILGSCEYGEDVAQRAYEAALESDAYMSTEIRQMISSQKSELKTSHDMIKKYRDMHEKVS
ncbi:ferritin-like domain-containing protein [Aridibaculum aurantiacum]|uniref:ferritin-like domain-containing protein n=1 Tax=Aridibaculum aurantiacum TaxID=2810307 RepID=UPI001A96E0FF|nr:PA2169 family four-helix-bundle protein [Aridibaculum aurantiacum]